MATTTIYCPDIECDSCVRVIDKALKEVKGVEKFLVKQDTVEVDYDSSKVKPEEIAKKIEEYGYRAGLEPFIRKTFGERYRDFTQNRKKYDVEYTMLKYSAYAFILLLALELALYFAFFKSNVTDFAPRYGLWIFYLDIAVVSIGAAMWHVQSYRGNVGMMAGMMIGMGFGMQTGLMIGTILGATNGMFIGTMAGIVTAVFVGWYNGKCCGIMGVLEGAMAGLMNGAMGAMTAVMLFADHLALYMPFFMVLNLIIMWGMSYMLFEEVVEANKKIEKTPVKFMIFFGCILIVVAVLALVMVYGPKSGLARVF